ncbi:MAG: AAA family ATPase [Steroidobacteraceae bacterium]
MNRGIMTHDFANRFSKAPDDAQQLAALRAMAAAPPPEVRKGLTEFLWRLARDYFPLRVATGPAAEWTTEPLWHVPGTGDDETLLRKMRASKSREDGVTFADLFDANVEKLAAVWPPEPTSKSGLPYDGNSADQSLANRFAWWTGGDGARIQRLMQREDCGLRREKYDRPDYLPRTIKKALALVAQNPPKDKTMAVPKFGGTLPAGALRTPNATAPPAAAEAFDYRKHMGSAQSLLDNPPPPIEFVQTGLLAKGATALLIGKPKSFKTTLAYQMALAYCGNPDLLSRWAEFGEVTGAYHVAILDYEQSDQIAAQLLARFGKTQAPGLVRLNTFPKLDEAGLVELEKLITGEKLDAVIIDSWTRAMPAMRPGAGVFMGEAEIMQRLTNLAHKLGCLVIVIAHGGKRDAADDPMQMIASTNALPASVDDVLVLFKDGDDEGGMVRRKLFVSGRNIAKPGTYVLEKHDLGTAFVLKGSEDATVRGEARQKIMALLGTSGGPMTPTAIGKSLGLDRANVHRALQGLVADKLMVALEDGKYESRSASLARKVKEGRK